MMAKMIRLKITLMSIRFDPRYSDVAKTDILIVTEFGTKYYKTFKYEDE
jgi:hypothetical protein